MDGISWSRDINTEQVIHVSCVIIPQCILQAEASNPFRLFSLFKLNVEIKKVCLL